MQIKAYIDIDGVLIRIDRPDREELIPRFKHVLGFLKANFDCYWLTTNVTKGSGSAGAIRRLNPFMREAQIDPAILDGIKPTVWKTLKPEAIDLNECFIWLDDDPLPSERRILHEYGCAESLIEIDWRKRAKRLTVRRLKRIRRNLLRASPRPE